MTTPSRLARLGWLLAALMQLILPAFASVMDARAEAFVIRDAAHAHVEAPGTVGCPRVHPDDCVICTALSSVARITRPFALPSPATSIAVAPQHPTTNVARSAFAPGDPLQRAPPILS